MGKDLLRKSSTTFIALAMTDHEKHPEYVLRFNEDEDGILAINGYTEYILRSNDSCYS